jgi:hypothetical protein
MNIVRLIGGDEGGALRGEPWLFYRLRREVGARRMRKEEKGGKSCKIQNNSVSLPPEFDEL